MSSDQLVVANLERWKEYLLDASKRNRLLHFAPKSAVQLVEPDLKTLWERLVARPKTLSFWGQDADLFADDENEGITAPKRPLKADEILADPTGARLNRLLYNLRSRSNLSLEEQGLTTLYVAWGFLKWRDPKTRDEVLSPLILSPVTLLRESSRAFYRLKLAEEDLWLNPVLQWKLNADFQIALPELSAFEDADPFAYFDAVRAVIARHAEWSVQPDAYLGLFSFHKMAMYNDLNEGQELALANPFVRALGGDPSRLPAIPDDLPQGRALDDLPMRESFGVLDCDSSQNEAVQAAGAGVSFVLQGPPGTGKSQTIANIIAHALGYGKRVLFVSEKMAALDVVHGRLESVGLGPFCLKAHSQGATKKEVIADLGRTLALAQTAAQKAAVANAVRQDNAETAELERLRAALNHYARELHQPRSPLNQSVYQAAGELALRPDAPEIAAPLPPVFEIDGARLSQWREQLEAAQGAREVWSAGRAHPWHGATPGRFSLDLLARVRARGSNGAALSRQIAAAAPQLGDAVGAQSPAFSLPQAEALPELAGLLQHPPKPPAAWFVAQDLEEHLSLAGRFKARFEGVKARRAALDARHAPVFWTLDLPDLTERATTRHGATLERGGTWEKFSDWGDEVIRRLETVARNLEVAAQTSVLLAASWELCAPQTLADIAPLASAGTALRDAAAFGDCGAHWFEREQLSALKGTAQESAERARTRDQSAAQLQHYELDAMNETDLGALAGRFETEYRGFLRVLRGDYRRDARQIAAWRKPGAPTEFGSVVADLQITARWQNAKAALEAANPTHRAQFGRAYAGPKTAWETIESDLARCESLADAFAPIGGVPANLARALTSGVSPDLSPLDALCAALATLQEELRWVGAVFSLRDWPFQNEGVDLALPHAPAREAATWLAGQANNLRDVAAALETLASAQFAEAVKAELTLPSNPYAPEPRLEAGVSPALVASTSSGEAAQTKRAAVLPSALVDDAREGVEVLRLEAELEAESAGLRARFEHLFAGAGTDWDAVLGALDWTGRAVAWWKNWARLGGETGEDGQATPKFIALATGETELSPFGDEDARLQRQIAELRGEWAFFADLYESEIGAGASLEDDTNWFEARVAGAPQLEAMLRWLETQSDLKGAGLWEFWQGARRADLDGDALSHAFERRFWSLWIDAALGQSPVLREFEGTRHQAARGKFCRLDAASLGAAERRLNTQLWEQKPVASGAAKTGEIATLQKEVMKKARLKPIRRLFREIPHLLGALKPCLLMSPLAVAQFLEAGRAEFDLVIFDEASQICPEDAVGAILRSRQLIVVGDRRQLPPTRFFAAGGVFDSDEDADDENDSDATLYESILDMCAPHLPNSMLLWHYRSRDETLISFSNRHFYDGRLITFPGPFAGGAGGSGVRLESVAGTYIRGKGEGAHQSGGGAARRRSDGRAFGERARAEPGRDRAQLDAGARH